jgi:hypothetical protein
VVPKILVILTPTMEMILFNFYLQLPFKISFLINLPELIFGCQEVHSKISHFSKNKKCNRIIGHKERILN